MKSVFVVVDMQKDFIDGALGSPEAIATVPVVSEKIQNFNGDELFVTLDTHYENYLHTLEGKKLPVPHCILGSEGHRLNGEIEKALDGKKYTEIKKTTFGTFEIAKLLSQKYEGEELSIEVAGLCTDICVISNVLILRAAFPNAQITVDSRACAGVTVEKHCAALEAMRSCQIDVLD